jgi:diguanylate cyclase (GGDEF)-like protein
VQKFAIGLAKALGVADEKTIKAINAAALLHDTGKLAVPEHILNKPGSLTEEEKKLVRQHPTVGAEIIGAVDFGYPVAPLIASHHERWNGQGYPNGLKGEEIPLGSRILGIVDYFDALIADRPYHKAWSEAEAREILRSEAGQVLDPKLVKMFLDILEEESPLGEVPSTPRATSAQANLSGHARDAAPAIETVIENIARANTEMVALYQLTEELGSRIELKDTIGILISRLSTLIPASAWALFLCDETEGASRCAHAQGLDSDRLQLLVIPEGAGVVGYLARQGKTIRNANPAGDFKAAGALEHGSSLRSMIACPLRRKTRTVGVLVAYHVEPGHFTEGHESTLEKVALKVAAVVDDAQTFEKVRTESLTDPLTGLHNSRALIDHIEREISSADDSNTERALLVIDVDRFKLINDRFGHPAGDRALQFIARAIRGSVRVDDFCARQGGDEFIVVLECDALHALERAIELQHAVSGIPFEPEPGVAVTLSISVGHAMYPSEGRSLDALIRQADHRMYQDKSGRKRRETRGFPVPAGLER